MTPFTRETAQQKVKAAQALWNTKDPQQIVKSYTEDSIWRNRSSFFRGHADIVRFLTQKFAKEKEYRLRKELFSFQDDRIAVQFWYEWYNSEMGMWVRSYGLEMWTFAADGRMRKRQMSANDVVIESEDRWFADNVDVDSVEISEVHW